MSEKKHLPCADLLVIDFSTLLPGPLATLLLAQMGAEVIKIENPDTGDPMRQYKPLIGETGANFLMLNQGKRSLSMDLKSPDQRTQLEQLLTRADIIVEQFRPGVMKRLSLDYDSVRQLKPDIIYCSITGYGQHGPLAQKAGHDLNYMAESGLLSLTGDQHKQPVLPPVLAADIAGGAYPALFNMLAAVLHRQQTGQGCHLDISMSDNLLPFAFWALGEGFGTGQWPGTGGSVLSGRSPRYNIYQTADQKFVAVAALENKFWNRLCDILQMPVALRADADDPEATRSWLSKKIATVNASALEHSLCQQDTCCSIVNTLEQAVQSPHFLHRGLFDQTIPATDELIPAIQGLLHPSFTTAVSEADAPALGEYLNSDDRSSD